MSTMRIRSRAKLITILLAAFAVPSRLAAQEPPADLAALLAEAEKNTPELLAARKAAEATAARVPQAGTLPDPMLRAGVTNLPAGDPSLSGDMMTMMSIGIGTTFPFPGKLALQEEVARLRLEAAEWETQRVRRKVAAEVKTAYYELYYLDRALDVTGENETLVADFARLTSAKYGVGTGAQPDVLKAQVERTRLQEQRVQLREKRASALARLNALLDRPTETPVPTVDLPEEVQSAALERDAAPRATFAYTPAGDGGGVVVGGRSVAELQQVARERNPMIQAHIQRVEAQAKAVSLADRATLPDFHVSVGYGHRVGFGDVVSASVSVPVPIFKGRKQDQRVTEASATLAEREAKLQTVVNAVNEEIASLAADAERARSQLVLLSDGILPQAEATLEAATATYRVGEVDFLTLLDAQVKLYRHELDYHRLLVDFAQTAAELERAVGTEVLR